MIRARVRYVVCVIAAGIVFLIAASVMAIAATHLIAPP